MFDSNPSDMSDISSREAFELLMGEVHLDKLVSAPYREDKNPSFIVRQNSRGNYYFIDYSTGDKGYWLDLYNLMYSGGYLGALKMFKGKLSTSINTPPAKIRKKRKLEIKVDYIDWSDDMLDYWRQFNISYYTLIHFNVRCIKSYKLGDYPIKYVLAYSYEFPNNERKILIPKGLKNNKWCTNSLQLEGYKQLPEFDDTLIITKSLKDVMLLYELNYTAIAPISESTNIDENIMKELKKRFKTIYILFDNDRAGRTGVKRFKKDYPFLKIRYIKKRLGKDISDVSKNHGLNAAYKTIKSLIK